MPSAKTAFAFSPWMQLSVLAAASLGIYWVAFLRPFSLGEWWAQPLQTIVKIAQTDLWAAAAYAGAMTALFWLYWQACRLADGPVDRRLWAAAIGGALVFSLAMAWLYPVGAADVFDNIIRGRMTVLYGANPFYRVPFDFQQDPLYSYAAWDYYPSAYGPLWELIAAGTAWLAGNEVIANVLAFKAIAILAYAATAAVIVLYLRRAAPVKALRGLLLFAWNPLVIYEIAGNGHNDGVMVLFVILGFYWLARGRYTLALLAQIAGALIKFIPILFVPIILITALRHLQDWRARTRYLLVTAGLSALAIVAVYAPFWQGWDVLGIDRRRGLFTTSLPALLKAVLEPLIGEFSADQWASGIAAGLLLVWLAWRLLVLWRSDDEHAPLHTALSICLFYLLVSCLWFQPWYLIWPLALSALLPDGTAQRGTVLFSFAATWKMPLFDFVIVGKGPLPPFAVRELQVTLGTLSAPWLYFLYHAGISIRQRVGIPARETSGKDSKPELPPITE
ncbi:MAG: DUF2029 domain-containing protein [Chloroflexi bacterium]|nr:DUF2029 domain-containing protein [Chloroflexota bacterium]